MRTLARATVTVDVEKIAENTRQVRDSLPGVEIVAVSKVTCGTPEVAQGMLSGGAVAIGESRLENAERLRRAGVAGSIWLLRATPPDLADDTVRLAEVSLASEFVCAEALDSAAGRAGRRHAIVAMVDVGDLREGMMPAELPDFLERVRALSNLDILGVGTSLTCYGAVVPDQANIGELATLAEAAERQLGHRMVVSAGSSTSIELVASGRAPASVDNLRIGEAIVLGVDPATRERILGLHTDAVTLAAPVIECKIKPSAPWGVSAQDAFGNRPVFEDRGERMRAICALGRQDAPPEGLRPLDPSVRVLGASSDHLILDVGDLDRPPAIGEAIEFVPGYGATLALFTSPYVDKVFREAQSASTTG
jgi:predicted amino acid racemase